MAHVINRNEWTFVLRDKGTHNQGWWLKISSVDELIAYIEETNPTRNGKIFENYIKDKCYNKESKTHGPYMTEADATSAVVMYGQQHHCTIFEAIKGFEREVALNRLRMIEEYGAIYINRVNGHTFMHSTDVEYAYARRKTLTWPDFRKDEIRVKSFPGGQHFYAYIDNVQVKQGTGNDTIMKWDTYDEAYQAALSYIDPEEQ